MDAVIVTGGFYQRRDRPDAVSTDVAALEGARRYCAEFGSKLASCYEAVPEPGLDRRPDVGGGRVRTSAAEGVTVRTLAGKTPLGRRLAMVREVDIVVTISGRWHTEVVGEHALEFGIPLLPLPIAGGDSEVLLRDYQKQIASSFAPGALEQWLETIQQTSAAPSAAAAVVDLLKTAKIGKCFVLMPFDEEHDALYHTTIEPIVARHMVPARLDRLAASGVIFNHLAAAADAALAMVVDVTRPNKNVIYEVGYAHGRGLTPLIYTKRFVPPRQAAHLPFIAQRALGHR